MNHLDLSHITLDLRSLAVPIATLREDAENARLHDARNIATIKASLKRFGQRKPLVVRKQGRVIEAGNGTLAAARELGWTHIAVTVVDDDKATATAYALVDNRSAELAEWDDDNLALHLQTLADDGFDLVDLGWDDGELSELLDADNGSDSSKGADDVPDALPEVITQPGDLWLLGEHRLLCGDSTREEDVARVLDGATPLMMVTDPPYGVEYDPEWRNRAAESGAIAYAARSVGKVANDDRSDWLEAWSLAPVTVVYCWHAHLHASSIQRDLEASGFIVRAQIIWAKDRFAISRGHYHWKHEPCWYAVKKSKTAQWTAGRDQTTLWEIKVSPNDENTPHSTQKPVECMARPIRNHGKPGDGVYEPFSGSGTTIIACEMLKRKCYAIELNPEYVDIAVRRWEKFTGGTAQRISRG